MSQGAENSTHLNNNTLEANRYGMLNIKVNLFNLFVGRTMDTFVIHWDTVCTVLKFAHLKRM